MSMVAGGGVVIYRFARSHRSRRKRDDLAYIRDSNSKKYGIFFELVVRLITSMNLIFWRQF